MYLWMLLSLKQCAIATVVVLVPCCFHSTHDRHGSFVPATQERRVCTEASIVCYTTVITFSIQTNVTYMTLPCSKMNGYINLKGQLGGYNVGPFVHILRHHFLFMSVSFVLYLCVAQCASVSSKHWALWYCKNVAVTGGGVWLNNA
jgi:hypothetical protein